MFQPKYNGGIAISSFLKFPSNGDIVKENRFFFNSASQGLMFFLQYIGSDLNIAVPLYTCSSVFNAISDAGHSITFIDVGLDSNYDRLNLDGIDVLIITHYFGKESNFSLEIKERYPKLVIIEDRSHCYLEKKIKKSFTDMALYSFNFHKPLVVGIGGCIEISSDYKNGIRQNYQTLSELNKIMKAKMFLTIFLKNLAFNPYIFFCIQKLIDKKREGDAKRHYNKIVPQKFVKFGLRILKNQFDLINRSLNHNYLNIPKNYRLYIGEDAVNYLSYFPILFKTKEERDRFKIDLLKQGIETYVLWENCFKHAKFYGLKSSDYPLTKNIVENILFLPSHIIKKNKYLNIVITNLK